MSGYKSKKLSAASREPNEVDWENMKIEFAPGAFDSFEGTQEELDGFMADITRMIRDGSLFEESVPLEDMPEEVQEMLAKELPKNTRN